MQTLNKNVYTDLFAICSEENACKNLIKAAQEKSKSFNFEIIAANKMNKKHPKDADVIINARTESVDLAKSIIQSLSTEKGVKKITFHISKQ